MSKRRARASRRSVAQAEAPRRDALEAQRQRRSRALRSRSRRTRSSARLRRREARQLTLIGLFLVVQVVVWVLTDDWWARIAAIFLTALVLPVVAVLAFSRR